MNILSMFAFFSALFALFQGLFVLYLNCRSKIHILFFFVTICLSYWSFCAVFGYSANTVAEVFSWLRLSTPGFAFLHVFTLHFILVITDNSCKIKNSVLALLYIPSVYFTWYGMTHPFVFDVFTRVGNFWIGRPMLDSPIFILFMMQYMLYYFIAAVIIIRWIYNKNSNRIRKQGILLLISICGTILIYNLESLILPFFTDYKTLVLSVNAGILWVTGFWIAIIRYHLFTWETDRLLHEIFNEVDQVILLLDGDLSIIVGNKPASQVLDLRHSRLCMPGVISLIRNLNTAVDNGRRIKKQIFFTRIKDSSNSEHSFRFKLTPMYDSYNDFYGYLLAGIEIKEFNCLQKQYSLTDREMEILHDLCNGLSGKDIAVRHSITLATVKSHCTHIYNKTGTNSRLEIMRMLADYNSDISFNDGLLFNRS
ncbi:MAG: LuxR C-terminal-related transcriptional regulator [Spirochaetes bacterium]|nr:LuxR C-terminal-related transcriptional regulator [Spirochaetota bacterium]